jgi:ABC-type lipoprotein release transport system permease subunit
LAWSNVAERRVEIGIWRACGLHARQVAAIFLGRWLLLGAIGSVTGVVAAMAVMLLSGGEAGVWRPGLLAAALAVAMLLSGVAASVAVLAAAREDPAVTLRSG